MPLKKPIPTAERRYQDYLRRKTLKVGNVYEARLIKARRGELRRVLALARDLSDPEALPGLLEESLSEASYLPEWWTGLWTTAGVPQAQAVARILRQEKAAGERDVWLATLRRYAIQRAGNEIVSLTGTWKSSLVGLLRACMLTDPGAGVEKLTKELYNAYVGQLEKWQCRRIAQTESMIGTAQAGALAAETLDVAFTKQWCISGLGNTRASHEMMDGVIVDENEPFSLPGGMMMYPHDPSMGADASEIINCACACIRRPKGANQTVPASEPANPDEGRILAMMKEMPDSIPEDERRAIAENNLEMEKELGIKKGKPMIIRKADEQSANPKFIPEYIPDPNGFYINRATGERFFKNPKYNGNNKRYHVNCATCTPAYELRRRGFDVKAKGRIAGKGDLNDLAAHSKTFDMWKNADGTPAKPTLLVDYLKGKKETNVTAKLYKQYLEDSTKEPGRYALTIKWKSDNGHATILERKKNGKLVYVEPQYYEAKKGVERSINDLCDNVHSVPRSVDGVMRIDNKVFDKKWSGLFTTK